MCKGAELWKNLSVDVKSSKTYEIFKKVSAIVAKSYWTID